MAVNKAGSRVANLTQKDFRITENGLDRPIAVFRNLALPSEEYQSPQPHLGSFSNRQPMARSESLTILLLDQMDSDPDTWRRAEPQVLSFLKSLRPSEHIAIYLLARMRGLQVIQDYEDDVTALLSRLRISGDSFSSLIPATSASQPGHPTFSKRNQDLGFYESGPLDSKFHRVQIRVSQAGVRLEYKPGYWATGSQPKGNVDEQLATALESPSMAEGIELQASGTMNNSGQELLTVSINPQSVRFINGIAFLDLIIGQKDAAGRVFAIPPNRISFSMSPAEIARGAWLSSHTTVALRSQSKMVRIALCDEASGELGSVDVPVHPVY